VSFESVALTLVNIRRLVTRSSRPDEKWRLITAYLKLRLMATLPWVFPSLRSSRVVILGFTVEFFDLPSVISLFEEIFINNDYLFKPASERPVIIDAGSNIGISILFFKWLYAASRITAFEADDRTYRVLHRNIELNNLEGVISYNAAVGESEGTIEFYYEEGRPGSHVNTTLKEKGLTGSKKAEAVRLSNYLAAEVDLLKLDIEGSEMAVLQDLAKSNKLKLVREIIIEYHHHIDPRRDEFSKALSILEENAFGYQISCHQQRPFRRETKEFILLYAYRKESRSCGM
jgi:FkbM family methyltransferase